MHLFTKYTNAIKYSHYVAMMATALLILLVVPGIRRTSQSDTGSNLISVFVNGTPVGTVKDATIVSSLVTSARKRLALENSGLVLSECNVVLSGSKDVVGQIDDDATVISNIYNVLKANVMKTKQPVYEVKINQYTVNLADARDVISLLEAAKDMYTESEGWQVDLVTDTTRELDVLTTKVSRIEEGEPEEEQQTVFPKSGAVQHFEDIYNSAYDYDSDDIYFGIRSVDFAENVEVVKAYVDADKISPLDEAIEAVTKSKEKSKIYEVVSGDTLSGIAVQFDMTIDDLVAMNPDTIKSAESSLREGDEIKVSSPSPELSVMSIVRKYYEESYEGETEIIKNDSMFTNEKKIIREGQPGFHKVIADQSFKNSELVATNIVHENVVKEPISEIIEVGTKIPPTYVYPVYGRISSSFGRRSAPKKGASTYHKGIDFAVPVGTSVAASCGGTVLRAGWGSGYGYCVYIQHPDGKITRYGHLSKILVKSGQSVSQGQKIALSGNTGVSTGPHLHFEILVNGSQVNPLNYLQ